MHFASTGYSRHGLDELGNTYASGWLNVIGLCRIGPGFEQKSIGQYLLNTVKETACHSFNGPTSPR